MSEIKTFLVGGAVRDGLLGLPVKDRDWVVVGATESEMLSMGFEQVGADFPVFLHPETKDEYALARKERKVAAGYYGFEVDFDPTVTLEDDLFRRDLTVNAMALSDDVELFDPFGGMQDLKDGVLRHVSEAFAEDPVRVLRVARFAARYGFKVAPETVALMKKLVTDGELDALVPERVWTEMWKAMSEESPTKFFWTLRQCGAMDKLFPELEHLPSVGTHVSRLALRDAPTLHRFALLFTESKPKKVRVMLERLKAPADVQKFVMKFLKLFAAVTKVQKRGVFSDWDMDPSKMMKLFKDLDAWRQGDEVFELCSLFNTFDQEWQRRVDIVLKSFRAARKVTFASLPPSKQQLKGAAVGRAMARARREKVKFVM